MNVALQGRLGHILRKRGDVQHHDDHDRDAPDR
jgi:hypothetical protein